MELDIKYFPQKRGVQRSLGLAGCNLISIEHFSAFEKWPAFKKQKRGSEKKTDLSEFSLIRRMEIKYQKLSRGYVTDIYDAFMTQKKPLEYRIFSTNEIRNPTKILIRISSRSLPKFQRKGKGAERVRDQPHNPVKVEARRKFPKWKNKHSM